MGQAEMRNRVSRPKRGARPPVDQGVPATDASAGKVARMPGSSGSGGEADPVSTVKPHFGSQSVSKTSPIPATEKATTSTATQVDNSAGLAIVPQPSPAPVTGKAEPPEKPAPASEQPVQAKGAKAIGTADQPGKPSEEKKPIAYPLTFEVEGFAETHEDISITVLDPKTGKALCTLKPDETGWAKCSVKDRIPHKVIFKVGDQIVQAVFVTPDEATSKN